MRRLLGRRLLLSMAVLGLGLLAAALNVSSVHAQANRPGLLDEQTIATDHFVIHYTFTGVDAISDLDANGDGIPDYVVEVGRALEESWRVQIDVLGWPPPAHDRGQGGDERIDVYLQEILEDGYAGYVETAGGYLGDNPLTPEQERRAAYAYMVMDNDYAEVDESLGETPLGLLQATAAHEFNHVVQAGIDDLDLHAWLYEATATWMEDEVYDDINDGVTYLDSVFKNPDICLVASVARGDDLHWYGEWLFMRLLSERFGADVVRDIWVNMRQMNGFKAIDAALAGHGTSLGEQAQDYAVANLLRAYDEGEAYPTVHLEASIDTGSYTPQNGVQSLGADYVQLVGTGAVTATLSSSEERLSLQAVGVRSGQADVFDGDGRTLTINRDNYDEVYLLIHNGQQIATEEECWFVDYTLDVQPATVPLSAVTNTWDGGRFVSPDDAPISVAGETENRPPDEPYSGSGQVSSTAEGLEVAFEVLIPASIPAGYEFDYAYVMSSDEFGDSDIYYVPGGGDTANLDYLDVENNWLSVAQSISPYADVQTWLSDIGYEDTPGDIRTIHGVDVLVEDLSEPDDPWYSATMILGNLFIVVDGDHREDEVIALVEGLIAAYNGPEAETQVPPGEATTIPQQPTVAPVEPFENPPVLVDDSDNLIALLGGLGLITLCVLSVCFMIVGPLVVLGVVLWRRSRRDRYYS